MLKTKIKTKQKQIIRDIIISWIHDWIDKIKEEMTKSRGVSYKLKKVVILVSLLLNNYFIWNSLIDNLKDIPTVHIISVNAEEEVKADNKVSVSSSVIERAGVSASPNVKGGGNTPPSIEDKIKKAFPKNYETMIAIAKAESRLIPTAEHTNKNGTRDVGLFQINSIHGYDSEKLKDVDFNLRVAREVLDNQGLMAWSVYNNGSYKQFLK